jgi:hypothetical protein
MDLILLDSRPERPGMSCRESNRTSDSRHSLAVEKVLRTFSTDENLRFSRTLRVRHVVPDVQQAVCPQPAKPDSGRPSTALVSKDDLVELITS